MSTIQQISDKGTHPFSCRYSPQIPELLTKLDVSIVISTYQAGKVVFISAKDENDLVMLPRGFDKPMGVDILGDKMLLATKNQIIEFKNSKELAKTYPLKPNVYDSLFIPIKTHFTGQVDMHDVKIGKEGIYAINTSFSCLCKIDSEYNFTPIWQPLFIDDLVSEDRCHLNGLVLNNGYPKYITALGKGNTHQSWRNNIVGGGVIIDFETNEILFDELPMPHSPKLYKNELYLLLSASGEFVRVDFETKKIEVIKNVEGFCRGLDIIDDFAFIGMSKLRKNSSTFAKLPFAEKAQSAGIKIIHIPTKSLVGELIYTASVDEIYEVKILKNKKRPNILNPLSEIFKKALITPNKTFWANAKSN